MVGQFHHLIITVCAGLMLSSSTMSFALSSLGLAEQSVYTRTFALVGLRQLFLHVRSQSWWDGGWSCRLSEPRPVLHQRAQTGRSPHRLGQLYCKLSYLVFLRLTKLCLWKTEYIALTYVFINVACIFILYGEVKLFFLS